MIMNVSLQFMFLTGCIHKICYFTESLLQYLFLYSRKTVETSSLMDSCIQNPTVDLTNTSVKVEDRLQMTGLFGKCLVSSRDVVVATGKSKAIDFEIVLVRRSQVQVPKTEF